MKRIINGVTYNTATSSVVMRYDYMDDDREFNATVYQTRGGNFYIVHEPQSQQDAPKPFFEAVNPENLERLVNNESNFAYNVEIVDEEAIKPPPEAAPEAIKSISMFLRIPISLKTRVEDAAKGSGVSVNTYAMRCLENCLETRLKP